MRSNRSGQLAVVTNLKMLKLDGLELLKRIKHDHLTDADIIIMNGPGHVPRVPRLPLLIGFPSESYEHIVRRTDDRVTFLCLLLVAAEAFQRPEPGRGGSGRDAGNEGSQYGVMGLRNTVSRPSMKLDRPTCSG